MTDMLITSLSQLPQLSVKARSSVFRYKDKDAPPQQVGRELNVQAILTGRLVQHGNDLTLHIELVDVKTETALWSGDYNRSMANLVQVQGEIARDISDKLRLRLTSTDQQRLTKRGTENAEAFRAYLKGIFYWNKGSPLAGTLLQWGSHPLKLMVRGTPFPSVTSVIVTFGLTFPGPRFFTLK